MVSIILPVYNRPTKFISTLKSIERQTYKDYEVIIVNDGSKEPIEPIFTAYYQKLKTDNHYTFINQKNLGAPAARNRGYRSAQGDYLFFCDADIELDPSALEIMAAVLDENPTVSYAFSSFKWGSKIFKVGDFDADKLKSGPCIHTMSLIRRTDFPASGWDESIKKLQDWDLWLTMLEAGKIGLWIPRVLFAVSPGGTISSWLPSFAYKLFPFLPSVKKYNRAVEIIKNKHGLQ